VHLGFAESIVIQVIDTGIGQLRIERSQVGQIEREIPAVINTREKTHQPARLPRSGMILNRLDDPLQRRTRAFHDRIRLFRSGAESSLFTGDDFLPRRLQFGGLHLIRDVEMQLEALTGSQGGAHEVYGRSLAGRCQILVRAADSRRSAPPAPAQSGCHGRCLFQHPDFSSSAHQALSFRVSASSSTSPVWSGSAGDRTKRGPFLQGTAQ